MKTQMLRTSIFALLATAAVYAESTPELRPLVQRVTNSTIPLTMTVGPDRAIAAKDPADQQQPLRLNLPGPVDREKPPVLMAPDSGGCPSCSKPFSSWQQFQMALSVLYWI
jgi:hypothetical protein